MIVILYIGRSAAICTIASQNITEELRYCEQPILQLKLKNASLIEIPSQISDANRDISFIDISGVGLSSIESVSFCNFKKITSIDFSNNSLNTLPQQMLSKCEPQLKNLSLSFNQITELIGNIFTKVTSLERIDLSSNRIEKILDDVFKPLVNLKILRLNNNRISIIDDDLFKHNFNLNTLTLNNNMLAAVDNGSFNGLKMLQVIELGNNPELKVIDLSGMGKILYRIQIENCSLSVLHIPIHGKIIAAHKNNISYIKTDQENELEVLDLSMNHIRNLNDLSPLIHLTFLDISNNELVEFDFAHLATLKSLKRLNIFGNPIKMLDSKALTSYLPSVREVEISPDSLDRDNLKEFNNWMRLNNVTLIFNHESASNITYPPKTSTIRSLPPLVHTNREETDIWSEINNTREHLNTISNNLFIINIKLNICLAIIIITNAIILGFVVINRKCCLNSNQNRFIWQREPEPDVLHNLVEEEEEEAAL